MASTKTKVTGISKATTKKQGKVKKSEPELLIPDAWINELANLELNDDEWSCSVVIIEETSLDSSVYLEQFNKAAINGNRLAVKVITQTVVSEFVKTTISKQQGKRATPLVLLCKEIYNNAGPDFEKIIPTSLLVYLLKYIILEYKYLNKYIRKNLANKNKEFEDYRQTIWPPSNVSTSVKSGKTGIKSEISGKGGVGQSKTKAFTNLRKRGEEWKDKLWIDDAPVDGPHLYIALSSFYDSSLPLELLRLQVPLGSIVELDYMTTKYTKEVYNSLTSSGNNSSKSSNSKTKRHLSFKEKAILENKKKRISKFWNEIDLLKSKLPTSLMFKHVMFLQLVPKIQNRCAFKHKTEAFRIDIYKQISHFMYDIFENYKIHKEYQNALKIKDVTDYNIHELPNMNIYNSILDKIPHEALTIACVLDAVLAQVCSLETKQSEEEKKEEETGLVSGTLDSLFKHLQKLNIEYDILLEPNIKSDVDFNASTGSLKHTFAPIKTILIHSDDISIKTFHFQKEIANFITSRTKHVLESAWNDFWVKHFIQQENDYNFIRLCNTFITSDKKCDQHILYYYLYILIINSILDTILLSSDFVPPEPLGRLTIYTLKEDISLYNKIDLCDDCLREIASTITVLNSFHKLTLNDKLKGSQEISDSESSSYSLSAEIIASNLFYVEDMSSNILLQNIQTNFTKFDRFETRFCPFTEQLVIVFHNLFSIREMREESWIGKLTTNVPERDFVEYILEEEFSWFDRYINQTPSQSVTQEMSYLSEYELGDTMYLASDSNFLSYRSLKYEQLRKEQILNKSASKSSKSGVDISLVSTDKLKNENDHKNIDVNKQEKTEVKEDQFSQKNKNFIGYELGEPQRFQFTGLIKEKIFEDNTKIIIHKIQKLYGEETKSLNITINGHTLYYNSKPTAVSNTPFHTILSSGIILYFGHPIFEENKIPVKIVSNHENQPVVEPLFEKIDKHDTGSRISDTEDLKTSAEIPDLITHLESTHDSSKFPHEINEADFHKIPSVYGLKMSTPSGLHVELIQLQQKDLLYVRQKLFSKEYKSTMVQKEGYRCYSSCGHIMKFLDGGEVEILAGNGAVYSIYEIKGNTDDNTSNEEANNLTLKRDLEEKKFSEVGKITKPQKKKRSKKSNDKDKKMSVTDLEPLLNTLDQELKQGSQLKLVNYKYTASDGRRYVIQESTVERIEDVLMITSIDICNNSINGERLDGLKSTHYADGSLAVYFPDGSCITSIPTEAEEVFCEWSSSEFDLWFTSSTEVSSSAKYSSSTTTTLENQHSHSVRSTSNDFEESISPSLKHSKNKSLAGSLILEIDDDNILNETSQRSLHEDSITSINNYGGKTVESGNAVMMNYSKIIYSEDGFVVYTLNYLMEHPNYSSVYYDSGNHEVEFKLPFSSSVVLKSNGSYRAFFEGATLIVEHDKVYFNRLNDNDDITRIVVVNTKEPIDGSNHEFETGRNITESFDESAIKSLSPVMQEKLLNFDNLHSHLLYSVNDLGNQMFIDFELNVHQYVESKIWHGIRGRDVSCFVINKDLSGFRLVDVSEVNQHNEFVLENNGLVRKSENTWSVLLTSIPVLENESQKWLMKRNESPIRSAVKSNLSTFGRRESWTKPFVKQDQERSSLMESETMIARVLYRIPTQENVLSELKLVLEQFKSCSKITIPVKITVDSTKGDLNLTEIINDPNILHEIYEEERKKAIKESDKFRNNMKNAFLRSLVRQACIKARKIRQKNKVEEFKYVLRTKNIPPYHLSCFGQVHNVLDKVLENVNDLRKTSSSFLRVRSIIDDILNLAFTADSQNMLETADDTEVIQEIVSQIFGNFCVLSKEKSYQNLINSILQKPLTLVTSEEVELLCRAFQSGSGDCPILYDEEFILQDILEARHQLSHYFINLKEMLEYYREHNLPEDSFRNRSLSFHQYE